MALSITNRGTGTHNTGATSFTLSPASNFAAGSSASLCVSGDNSSSGGATNDITSVTDSLGNTWTKQQGPVFDNGAASAGVQGAIFTTEMNAGALTTGTTITVNFGSSPVAKTWTLTQVAPAAGKVARVRTSGSKAAGATATAASSGATGTVNVGEVVLCAIFIEAGTTQTCTGDSDTTNGTWSTLQYAEIGSTTSGSCIASQAKLQTTANSTQTYDVTLGISSDYHAAWVIFEEITPPISVTPTAGVATAAAASPTVTLGGLSVTPTVAIASAVAASPTIALGGIAVTPTAGSATALAADPTVDNAASGQNITPTTGAATAAAAAPTIALGGIASTPTAAIATAQAAAPTIALGGISRTPTTGVATAQASSPTVQLGAISATPTAGASASSGASPSITLGGITVTPTASSATAIAAAPTKTLGAIGATPVPAIADALASSPIVVLGGIAVTPLAGSATALGADASSSSGIVVTPTAGVATAGAAAPTVTNVDPPPPQDPSGATAAVVVELRASAILASSTQSTATIVPQTYPTAKVIEDE